MFKIHVEYEISLQLQWLNQLIYFGSFTWTLTVLEASHDSTGAMYLLWFPF